MSRVLDTPDGRYIVVRGRLWRRQRPDLTSSQRDHLVRQLMNARRQVKTAKRSGDAEAMAAARREVDSAKHGLGERGPVWWADGSADLSRRLIANTPYAEWYADLPDQWTTGATATQ